MTIDKDDRYIVADNRGYYPSVVGYKTKKEAEQAYNDEIKYITDNTVVLTKIIKKKQGSGK